MIQRTILYVDDNPKAVRMLRFALEGSGYRVVAACKTRDALEQIEQIAFDLILLACRVPKMAAFELAREIKQVSPETPIILVSNQTLLASDDLTHVDAYVGKGARLDILLGKIQSLTAKK